MAGVAGLGRAGKLAIGVARGAGRVHVRAGERKLREGIVIETRPLPCRGGVARRAILRESGRDVVGILRGVEIFQVARSTIRGSAGEFPSGVAGNTREAGMAAGERKSGDGLMVESGAEPRVHLVTSRAGGRKFRGEVIRKLGGAEGIHVARGAFCGKAAKLTSGCARMAGGTFGNGMCAQEREAVLMLIDAFE